MYASWVGSLLYRSCTAASHNSRLRCRWSIWGVAWLPPRDLYIYAEFWYIFFVRTYLTIPLGLLALARVEHGKEVMWRTAAARTAWRRMPFVDAKATWCPRSLVKDWCPYVSLLCTAPHSNFVFAFLLSCFLAACLLAGLHRSRSCSGTVLRIGPRSERPPWGVAKNSWRPLLGCSLGLTTASAPFRRVPKGEEVECAGRP